MTENQLLSLTQTLLWLAFALGLGFAAIARRNHFCTMGAVADIDHMGVNMDVNKGDWSRMRIWALAAGVAVLGSNAMVALGSLKAADTIFAAPTLLWLSHAVGGLMFGIGMVLASGCGNRNLVRLGGGNLKSLLVLGVMAVAAFATLKGLTAVWRVATVDGVRLALPTAQDLPSLTAGLGGSLAQRAAWLGYTVGQGLSGLSTLSLGSFITLAALIVGAVLGLRWQAWRIERQA